MAGSTYVGVVTYIHKCGVIAIFPSKVSFFLFWLLTLQLVRIGKKENLIQSS